MRAIWNGATLAQAEKEQLVRVGGDWYFPPETVAGDHFQESSTHTRSQQLGEASYYHVSVNDQMLRDAAWFYPEPIAGAIAKAGRDFAGYVAFAPVVDVME